MARSPRHRRRPAALSIQPATRPASRPAAIEAPYRGAIARAIIASARGLAGPSGSVGRSRLVNFLRGNVFPAAADGLPWPEEGFGLLERHDALWIREVIDRLVEEGYLESAWKASGSGLSLRPSPLGERALAAGHVFPPVILPSRPRLGSHPETEARLRAARRELAAAEGRAPYGIFTNRTLAELAARVPKTLAELSEVPGLGEARVRMYGKRILAALRGAK